MRAAQVRDPVRWRLAALGPLVGQDQRAPVHRVRDHERHLHGRLRAPLRLLRLQLLHNGAGRRRQPKLQRHPLALHASATQRGGGAGARRPRRRAIRRLAQPAAPSTRQHSAHGQVLLSLLHVRRISRATRQLFQDVLQNQYLAFVRSSPPLYSNSNLYILLFQIVVT